MDRNLINIKVGYWNDNKIAKQRITLSNCEINVCDIPT